ncbi:MAG: serine endoprotease DegQ, partial [Pseudomonadota bacterium]
MFYPSATPSLLLLLLLCAVKAATAAMPLDVRGAPTLAPMLAQVTPAVVNISVVTR